MEKIALITDSGTDVPREIIEEYGIYELPLHIVFSDREYRDKIDIDAEGVFALLGGEIPKTSLPSPSEIMDVFDRIKADGYTKAIAVTISSGLSGTFNAVRMVAEMYPELETRVVDAKSIGIGAGLTVVTAAMLIRSGIDLPTLNRKLCSVVLNTSVFFCLETLEYLEKGGRIGHVAAALGRVLNLKPIITCNKEGVYATVAKSRGRAASLTKALELARSAAEKYDKCVAAVVESGAREEAANLFAHAALNSFPHASKIYSGNISPALVVHTGPGLIGIAVQKQIY